MGDESGVPSPRRPRFEVHEVALLALGSVTSLALLAAGQVTRAVTLEAALSTILYGAVIFACIPTLARNISLSHDAGVGEGRGEGDSTVHGEGLMPRATRRRFRDAAVTLACGGEAGRFRIRLLASYAFVVWFYCAVARITPALGTTLRDGALLAIDEAVFGQTAAIFLEEMATAWLTNLMSLCYLTYHLYLVMGVAHAALVTNIASQRLCVYLFTGFAVGFAGYLLVPAVGPALAYPELFRAPLPGGAPARLVAEVVAAGSSRYDVFPSLHVLITCILLDHDWRHVRRRFWIMVVPSLGLLISTVYLRYHYGADIVAGLLLFLALRQAFLKAERREARIPA